jgi:cullin-associated NEDD8-dissociated protein 1
MSLQQETTAEVLLLVQLHFKPIYLQALSGPVLSAVGERYYKVTAEALRVCGELVRVVRPNIEVILLFSFGV